MNGLLKEYHDSTNVGDVVVKDMHTRKKAMFEKVSTVDPHQSEQPCTSRYREVFGLVNLFGLAKNRCGSVNVVLLMFC